MMVSFLFQVRPNRSSVSVSDAYPTTSQKMPNPVTENAMFCCGNHA